MHERYGGEEFSKNRPEKALLEGAKTQYIEYTPDGRVLKGLDGVVPISKYEEDILEGNHSQVWGSYFDKSTMSWGFGCCFQTVRNSYCTGEEGKRAKLAALKFGSSVEARKEAANAAKETLVSNKTMVKVGSVDTSTDRGESFKEMESRGEKDDKLHRKESRNEKKASSREKRKKSHKSKRERKDKPRYRENDKKKRRRHNHNSDSNSSSETYSSESSYRRSRKEKRRKNEGQKATHSRARSKETSRDEERRRDVGGITDQELESYRLNKVHSEDPMGRVHNVNENV